MNREIDQFKTDINLTEFAATIGYQIDRRESSRNSLVLRRNADHDKVIVSKGTGGHWTYFSVRNERDNGTIIDFIQFRLHISLGEVRKLLRPWISRIVTPSEKDLFFHHIEPSTKDKNAVMEAYAAAISITVNDYLLFRGILQSTLQDTRFSGCIQQDKRGNTLFPHFDQEEFTGHEIKNFGFTGFTRYGTKAIWRSQNDLQDNRLVIVEAALDALSYHQIQPDQCTRYISIAGQITPYQLNVIAEAISLMPTGSSIILAFDNDESGDLFSERFKNLVPDYTYIRHAPSSGKDWNDLLFDHY